MPTINGSNWPLGRCPSPGSWDYGAATAMSTSATLTADRACVEMYMQSSSSNISAVYVGMNAAGSLALFEVPRGVATTMDVGLSVCPQPGWFALPCPSTTVPQFYSNVDTQKVRCMWR
jgi:hypothetical protein